MESVTIGDCTLFCGDSLAVLPTLAHKSVDALITDPPYGIVQKYSANQSLTGKRTLSWDWDHSGDVHGAISGAIRLLRRPANAFAFCGFDTAEIARDLFREAGMSVKPFVWTKPYPPPAAPGNRWPSCFELACHGFDPGAYFGDRRVKRRNRIHADTLRAGNGERAGHPTQKPLRVMRHLVRSLACRGGAVLDPFMGSASTGVACVQTGRRFVGIETNPKYFEIACRRIRAAVEDRQSRLALEVA